MRALPHTRDAQPGDWLRVRGLPGLPSREGQILEVLGGPGHEHFRVRWDEGHESIFFPVEGTSVVRHPTRRPRRRARSPQ
ncbi:MAG: DUF1918 domain-containing protein [Solirubrobacteraceae bacterium]